MKDIIMLDLVKVCKDIDKYDKLVMCLHELKLDYHYQIDYITSLKQDPSKLASIRDIFSFNYSKRIASKVIEHKELVAAHLVKISKVGLLTIEHLDQVMLPWMADTTARVYNVTESDLEQYSKDYIGFRPEYHKASRELIDCFKAVLARNGSYVYSYESQGAFNQKCNRYLREIEYKALSFRTMIASIRLDD